VVTGPNTVIEAMAHGKLAAEMIDKYIRGEEVTRTYGLNRPSAYHLPVELSEEEMETAAQPVVPSRPASERTRSFAEVELGITEEAAVREARRCLRCDLQTEEGKKQLELLRRVSSFGRTLS